MKQYKICMNNTCCVLTCTSIYTDCTQVGLPRGLPLSEKSAIIQKFGSPVIIENGFNDYRLYSLESEFEQSLIYSDGN